MGTDNYTECSGCGLMFHEGREAQAFEAHDCTTDEALFLSTDEDE
jgi:hypothetical protein